jgi:hypothetical protein
MLDSLPSPYRRLFAVQALAHAGARLDLVPMSLVKSHYLLGSAQDLQVDLDATKLGEQGLGVPE